MNWPCICSALRLAPVAWRFSRAARPRVVPVALDHALMVGLVLTVAGLSSCRTLSAPAAGPWIGESGIPLDLEPVNDGTMKPADPAHPAKPPVAATNNGATDRRPAVPTSFSAAELVREKVTVDKKEEYRMVLRGDATIVHDTTTLKAPAIILDPGNEGRLVGGVTVYDRAQGMILHANEGYYSRSKETVRLWGNPRFEFQQKGEKPILATVTEIQRDLAANVTTLDGDLRMHGEKWTLLADRGVYSEATGVLHLSVEPLVIGKDIFLTGGDFDYNTKERTVVLRHRPLARMSVLEGAGGKEGGSRPRRQPSVIDPALVKKAQDKTATPAELETLKKQIEEQQKREGGTPGSGAPGTPGKGPAKGMIDPLLLKKAQDRTATPAELELLKKQMAEAQASRDAADGKSPATTEGQAPALYDLSAKRIEYRFGSETEARLVGDVRITSKVRTIHGEEFRLSGSGLSLIESEKPFEMHDGKEGMDVKGSRLKYDTKKRWIWMSGRPVITMKEKDGQTVKAVLEAAVIERDMEKEIIHATGAVRMKRRNEEAIAEMGVFREKDETMDLSGHPYLNRKGAWVRCKRVRMYSNPDRVVFEEDFSGGTR